MSAKHVFPFKFSRVKRFTWLGAKRILNADWMHRAMRKAAGKRHLMMIAGKSGGYIFNERDIGAGP
jgi:hypothetical protein